MGKFDLKNVTEEMEDETGVKFGIYRVQGVKRDIVVIPLGKDIGRQADQPAHITCLYFAGVMPSMKSIPAKDFL